MTLIAFHACGDNAEIITDSLAYSHGARHLGEVTKVHHLHHLRAVLATQGDVWFGCAAGAHLSNISKHADDFDGLLSVAPAILRRIWEAEDFTDKAEAALFIIGWSPEASEFVSCGLDAKTDFEPWRIEGPFMIPTPHSLRPSEFEFGILEPAVSAEALASWREAAEMPTPQSPQDWVHLALTAWEDRALTPAPSRVFIGGSLYFTQLNYSAQATHRLFDFDPPDEDFLKMVEGTLHPRAQLAPCPFCESGKVFVDCCADLDVECPCGSGSAIRDCCMLTPEERAQAESELVP
ncbi:hypothetical protein [Aeromicrobium sp.]|uniref:hypothetical protein n=1 Tax=Aeromicrobium sp. TaxID=1871063 RepID=UPI002FC72523